VGIVTATHWRPPGGAWPEDFADPAFQAHLAASIAAHERCKAYTRLYARRGSVAHLSPPWGHPGYVLCGFEPQGDWRGTGSQDEYELAAELAACSRCRRLFMDSQRCGNPECQCQKWGACARVAGDQ
jgi:hypothetical protein